MGSKVPVLIGILSFSCAAFAGRETCGAVPAGYPSYMVNFSTDAQSLPGPYSMPGLLPSFSVPGGDILGIYIGNGTVLPPMTCNRPGILVSAGAATMGMGFGQLPFCTEVDAYSTGDDWDGPADPWVIMFSVDRASVGFSLPRPTPPGQFSDVFMEAAVNDAAADIFVSGAFLRFFMIGSSLFVSIGTVGWNYLGFDGDGIVRAGLPAAVPTGLGLVEQPALGVGENLDGVDNLISTFRFNAGGPTSPFFNMPILATGAVLTKGLFLSLDPASAAAYGVSPADILATNGGFSPWVWAPASRMGLNPATDDIDALAIWLSPDPSSSPVAPGMTFNGRAIILFSVSRGSSIVGQVDPLWGIPIMPSDILTVGDWLGFPGQTVILFPSGAVGLLPFLQRPPGVFTDDLDALAGYFFGECPTDSVVWDTFLCAPSGTWLSSALAERNDMELPVGVTAPVGPVDPNLLFPPIDQGFKRGDPNGDGECDISDGIFVLNFLFIGGHEPGCRKSADTDDSGEIDISDGISILNFQFLGGKPPHEPFVTCGADATPDELSCVSYVHC
jgi:hypothetical protein